MNSIEFNNDPLRLPGSTLNPIRYKLPSQIIRSPFKLPTEPDLPSRYNLPMIESAEEFDLPGIDAELEMQLGTIPSPYRETVRYIHSGISPRFTNGFVILSMDAENIHHIVKRSFVRSGLSFAKDLLPFNGSIKQTFEMFLTTEYGIPRAGTGNLLINLIPLDYSFHHKFIEERPYDHVVYIKLNGEMYAFTIPELLMSFNILNLNLRFDTLSKFVSNGWRKSYEYLEKLKTMEEVPPTAANAAYDLMSWERIAMELPRIPILAKEIENEHPILYRIWKSALGPLYFRQNVPRIYEQ